MGDEWGATVFMSLLEHKQNSIENINMMVLTISDTRDEQMDKSGQLMMKLIKSHSFNVKEYKMVKDEREKILSEVMNGIKRTEIDVILTNGGTGLSNRDVTFDVIEQVIERPIPGFGELFRMLSYEEIGSAAILSRAMGGIAKGTVIFSTPGSTGAVKLAMEKLILPELSHIIKEIRKD